MYTYIYIYTCVYIYVYIEREIHVYNRQARVRAYGPCLRAMLVWACSIRGLNVGQHRGFEHVKS